jgi:hypothetical protein
MGMQKQNDRYEQYQEPEQDKLQPVEEMLLQENYPAHIIENYPKLLKKDMHLAEIYRLGTNSQQDSSDSDKNIPINPFQVRIDRKGQVLGRPDGLPAQVAGAAVRRAGVRHHAPAQPVSGRTVRHPG